METLLPDMETLLPDMETVIILGQPPKVTDFEDRLIPDMETLLPDMETLQPDHHPHVVVGESPKDGSPGGDCQEPTHEVPHGTPDGPNGEPA